RIPLGDVSRKHCRLVKDNGELRVEDLGSSNGTFHNGQRVQEAVLEPGDALQIGPVTFVVQVEGVPSDDELQPPDAAVAMAESMSGDELEEMDSGVTLAAGDDQTDGFDPMDVLSADDEDEIGEFDFTLDENASVEDSVHIDIDTSRDQ